MNKEIFIQPKKSLATAIKSINKTGHRCLLVTSEIGQLLGVLSDGDIRRSILTGYNIEDSIENLYNKDPFYIYNDQLDSIDLHQIFLDKKYDLIPIVDQEKNIKDIYYYEDIYKGHQPPVSIREDAKVIIMAGGLGSRLLPLTKDIPKPMIKIDSRPIIQIVIENFYKYGIRDFLISVNHMSDQIISYLGDGCDFDVNIDYLYEDEPLGTCGSLSLIKKLDKNITYIVTNADILADLDISDLLREHNSKNADISVCTKLHEVKIPYGVVRGEGYVKAIEEKPNKTFWINSGIYVINADMLSALEYNKKKDMPDFIRENIKKNKNVAIYPMTGYWKDIGDIKELTAARDRYKSKH